MSYTTIRYAMASVVMMIACRSHDQPGLSQAESAQAKPIPAPLLPPPSQPGPGSEITRPEQVCVDQRIVFDGTAGPTLVGDHLTITLSCLGGKARRTEDRGGKQTSTELSADEWRRIWGIVERADWQRIPPSCGDAADPNVNYTVELANGANGRKFSCVGVPIGPMAGIVAAIGARDIGGPACTTEQIRQIRKEAQTLFDEHSYEAAVERLTAPECRLNPGTIDAPELEYFWAKSDMAFAAYQGGDPDQCEKILGPITAANMLASYRLDRASVGKAILHNQRVCHEAPPGPIPCSDQLFAITQSTWREDITTKLSCKRGRAGLRIRSWYKGDEGYGAAVSLSADEWQAIWTAIQKVDWRTLPDRCGADDSEGRFVTELQIRAEGTTRDFHCSGWNLVGPIQTVVDSVLSLAERKMK